MGKLGLGCIAILVVLLVILGISFAEPTTGSSV